jgi:hypothetical protein
MVIITIGSGAVLLELTNFVDIETALAELALGEVGTFLSRMEELAGLIPAHREELALHLAFWVDWLMSNLLLCFLLVVAIVLVVSLYFLLDCWLMFLETIKYLWLLLILFWFSLLVVRLCLLIL